jgi:hypothetical protein
MTNVDWIDGSVQLPIPQNEDVHAKNIEIRSKEGIVSVGTYYGTVGNASWTTNGKWKLDLGYQPEWRYVTEDVLV